MRARQRALSLRLLLDFRGVIYPKGRISGSTRTNRKLKFALCDGLTSVNALSINSRIHELRAMAYWGRPRITDPNRGFDNLCRFLLHSVSWLKGQVFAAIALKPFTKLPSFLDPLDQYIDFLHEIDKAPVVPELGFETQWRDPAEESDDTAPKKQIGHVLDGMDDLASDVEDIAQDMKDKCDWLVAETEVATENLGDVHLNRADEDAKFLEAVQRCLTRATRTVWETPSLWQTRDLLEEYMRLEESYGRS
ncbi:uncharacterized protein JN550_012599 [Neoarthrinium moseri]|uniref:uncharacterized protein n=1 Tax=Neoarthrinium moseri TaxID=1658444 RepID=UPI001FDAEBDB|nr:uncharacterized protein JN550_012599 [Neoarthrinium moseri]KAI1858466.1 hypothetical protein JN550_012599 [Neoarthrinium moseri]